jgi:hypothetical protein
MDCTTAGSKQKIAKRPKSGKSENSQIFSPVLRQNPPSLQSRLHFWKAGRWVWQKNKLSDVSAPSYFCPRARRDTACSLEDFSTKGGNCTGHDDHFLKNTKPP